MIFVPSVLIGRSGPRINAEGTKVTEGHKGDIRRSAKTVLHGRAANLKSPVPDVSGVWNIEYDDRIKLTTGFTGSR